MGTPRNYDRRTLGGEVGELATMLGRPLMPWQQYVADVALEVDETGELVYSTVDLAVERQQGKTTLILPVMVHRCRIMFKRYGPQFVAYTAQDGNHARRKWETDYVRAIDASAFGPLGKARIRGKHATVRLSNGSEGIFWRNGSQIRPTAPTATAGHGDAIDLAVVDEAFAHVDDRVEQAFDPAMMTRKSTQLWRVSAAGTDRSLYWWPIVQTGRVMCEAGKFDGPRCYFEWSASDDEDYRDPKVWRRRMPALGHTVTEEKVRSVLAKVEQGEAVDADDEGTNDLGLERFLRPYLGVWCRTPAVDKRLSVITAEQWRTCRDRDSKLFERGPLAFGVEVSHDRSLAVIAAAGPSTRGGIHVEVVETRLGVDWLVERVAALTDKWQPMSIGLTAIGEAGSLVPAMERLGLPVVELKARDYQRACGDFYDAVMSKSLRQISQDNLDAAVAAAARRQTGDSWVWDRRGGGVDLSPLVAVTVARWIATTVKPVSVGVPAFTDLADYLNEDD